MDLEQRIQAAETKQFKIVFPGSLNNHNTLFGGTAIQWMDEVAFITATRFLRKKMVTVSIEKVNFINPIKQGTIVEITGKILKIGQVKIKVRVEVFMEGMYSIQRTKAISSDFYFAAIDNDDKPTRIQLDQ